MKYFHILIITIFVSSCNITPPGDCSLSEEKRELSTKVRNKAALQIFQETGLTPCGIGAQAMDKIQMLALSFDCRTPLTIESARALLIKAVDTFVEAVNKEEKIRPYLGNFPFKPQNIEIRIFIHKPDESSVNDRELTVVTAIDGILRYKIPAECLFTTILSESYEEAIQKLSPSKTDTIERHGIYQ